MQNIFKKLLFYGIFIIGEAFMNKKTNKILVWVMLFLMIFSVASMIIAYALN